jgi:Proteasome subunit A N-terminal signature/Proteasome subunit
LWTFLLVTSIAFCANDRSIFVSSASAAAGSTSSPNNNNYNPYQYDMTTPQFTPDGRLLQVEYATMASSNSLPLVVVQCGPCASAASHQQPFCLIVAARRRTASRGPTTSTGDARRRKVGGEASAFERLVLLPVACVTGIDGMSVAVLGMSGVLADCLLLLRSVQDEVRKHSRTVGGRPFTIRQLAAALANLCQHHAFGGGIRPIGATMVVCGLEEDGQEEHETALPSGDSESLSGTSTRAGRSMLEAIRVWQTDPSGALQQLPSSYSKGGFEPTIHVVGGSDSVQAALRRKLRDRLLVGDDGSGSGLEIGGALRIVVDILRKELDPAITYVSSIADANSPADADTQSLHATDSTLDFEAAVISPQHGDPYKLTPSQIERLLASRVHSP